MRIRFDGEPNAVRVGKVLIDGVTGNGHRQKYQCENRDLCKFLTMEVVENGEKEESIDQDANEFLTGDIFNIGSEVADDCVERKGKDGPANGRPKKLRPRA